MLAAVTYSTGDYEKARKYNVKMAYEKGHVDKVFEYNENDLSGDFRAKNQKTLSCKRGAGYWVWKPYVVNRALSELNYDDYLFYCDSGAFITKEIQTLVKFMGSKSTDLLLFELGWSEKTWTKRDVFIELQCDSREYFDSKQRCATYFLIKKTKKTEKFVSEWLEHAQKYELISDEDNAIHRKPNYEGFRENRHDQSIFSVLSKKYGYKAYEDISQYRYPYEGQYRFSLRRILEKKEYPVMICLHRQKKADGTMQIRQWLVDCFPKLRKYVYWGYR